MAFRRNNASRCARLHGGSDTPLGPTLNMEGLLVYTACINYIVAVRTICGKQSHTQGAPFPVSWQFHPLRMLPHSPNPLPPSRHCYINHFHVLIFGFPIRSNANNAHKLPNTQPKQQQAIASPSHNPTTPPASARPAAAMIVVLSKHRIELLLGV